MSCPNATAPIDINMGDISGKCDLKCEFSFAYINSSCVATNRGDYIALSYDDANVPPVIYNTVGYNVFQVRIYTPSLHSYSGTKADAELIIIHTSNTGTSPLLVCIPINTATSTSPSAILFKNIITTTASSAPSDGEHTNINISNYNLTDIVPRKPFFSYSATEPYLPCTGKVNYIVYNPLTAVLDIQPDILQKLKSIISDNTYAIKTGPKLFYNETGPIVGAGSDQIYIDCQPVGQSDESEMVAAISPGDGENIIADFLDNPLDNQYFLTLLIVLIGIILFFITYSLADWINPKCTSKTH